MFILLLAGLQEGYFSNVGETQNFLLAIGLHQTSLTIENWKNICIDQLSLVLSIYPQKIIFQYS